MIMNDIQPFGVMEILERAKQLEDAGRDIIHLEVGEPDFVTPECICKAGIKALQEGRTKYTHSLGLTELREEIARYYLDEYNVEISPAQVMVTPGTSPAMMLLFLLLIEPDDEVLLSDPYYTCYPNFIKCFGGKPVYFDLKSEEGFEYNIDRIKAKLTSRTRAIIINSPSNPTGMLVPPEILKDIANLGYLVISDEIYHGLVYDAQAHSILEYTDNAFVLNGFSKKYAMTGWRLGYIIAPKEYMRTLQILQQNFIICTNEVVQVAGIAALKYANPDVENMVKIYNQRRIYMVDKLREIGFGVPRIPQGAFYVLADASKFDTNSTRLATQILEKVGVGVTPGADFGTNATTCIRFSYANSLERIKEALTRIEMFCKQYNIKK